MQYFNRYFYVIYIFLNSFLNLVPNIYYFSINYGNFTLMEKNYFDYILLYNICLSFLQYMLIYSVINKYNALINSCAIFIINIIMFTFNAINAISQDNIIIYSLNTGYYIVAIIILIGYFITWLTHNTFDRYEFIEQIKTAIKPT